MNIMERNQQVEAQALRKENECLKKSLARAQSVIRQLKATIRKMELELPAKKNKFNFQCSFQPLSDDEQPVMKSVCQVEKIEALPSPKIIEKKYSSKTQICSPRNLDRTDTNEMSNKIFNFAFSPQKTDQNTNNIIQNVAMSQIIFNRGSANKIIGDYMASVSTRKSKIFQAIKKQKPPKKRIFSSFFVTGIDERSNPIIQYSYPMRQDRQKVVLELFYGESSVQPQTKQPTKDTCSIKDSFIMPLLKLDEQQGWDYLVGCETDGTQYNKVFPRLYCFITNCHLFTQLQELLARIVDSMRDTKINLSKVLDQRLKSPLSFLYSPLVTEGMVIDLQLNQQLKFTAEQKRYFHKEVLNKKIHFTQGSRKETTLYGMILVYLLAQMKVILYSKKKARLSDTILALLQVIKPIEYVHPIIMALLTPNHEQFVHSPVPLLLGLWTEPSRKNRKLQIVFNQEEGTCNLIDRGQMEIPGGILIHLDTGLVFGQALNDNLNELATNINAVKDKICQNSKNVLHLFSQLMNMKTESLELKNTQKKLKVVIQKTQLYQYYKEKQNKK